MENTHEVGRRLWVVLPATFDQPILFASRLKVLEFFEASAKDDGFEGEEIINGEMDIRFKRDLGYEAWLVEVE